MIKISDLFTKAVLVTVVLALGLAAFPLSGVAAAGLEAPATPPTTPVAASKPDYPRLERLWKLEQARYQREENLLSKTDGFIARIQTLLDKASQKGWDVSAVQAALDAFAGAIPAAQAAHVPGEAIIRTHSGFNANGEVTNREKAVETVKALAQVLKDTRAAMNGTVRALWQAIREFKQQHPRTGTVTP